MGGSRQQMRPVPHSRQPPPERRNNPGRDGKQGTMIRKRTSLCIRGQFLKPTGPGELAIVADCQWCSGPRDWPGAQGQNTYLSRASILRSAPNQQLFWS